LQDTSSKVVAKGKGTASSKGASKAQSKVGSSKAKGKLALARLLLQNAARRFLARRCVVGWVRCVDEDDGDIYWFNEVTGVSSWWPPGHDDNLHVDGTPKEGTPGYDEWVAEQEAAADD